MGKHINDQFAAEPSSISYTSNRVDEGHALPVYFCILLQHLQLQGRYP